MINYKNIKIIDQYSDLHSLSKSQRDKLLKEQRPSHNQVFNELENEHTRSVAKFLLRN